MKKTVLCILLAALLCLSLGAPALADDEPEQLLHFYDTIGIFDEEEGTEVETRLVDLSRDEIGFYAVLVENAAEYGEDLDRAAGNIYLGMDFGNGEGREGVLLLAETETSSGTLYVNGETAEALFTEDARAAIIAAFDDTETWYDAMLAYADGAETVLLGEDYEAVEWFFFDVDEVMTEPESDAIDDLFRRISETYGVGVYGVVVPESSPYGETPEAAAELIYTVMEFGKGEARDGILLLAETEAQRQTLHVGGAKAEAVFTEDARAALLEAFRAQLPLYQDAYAGFGDNCETLLQGGTLAAVDSAEVREAPEQTEAPQPTEAPAAVPAAPAETPAPAAEAEQIWYLYDIADLLTDAQEDALEQKLRRISETYNCGVYIATVDDYRDYGSGGIEDVSEGIYYNEDFGIGPNRDGLFLFLSMGERDYDFFRNGWGNVAVTEKGKDRIVEAFKDDFRSDDWNAGLNDFADECAEMLRIAAEGEPYGSGLSTGAKIAIIVLPALVIAGIACAVMLAKMRSVRRAADADAYTTPGSLNITESVDLYTHTTETRRKIESSSRSGGGGGSSHSSGKF